MVASNTYGRQVVLPLTNKSGGSVAAGDVVILDGSNNEAFTTTTSASSTTIVGIVQETIASNATGRVLLQGYAALVNVNASVTRGHYGATHTVAKQAADAGTTRTGGTFCFFLTGGTTPTAAVYNPDLSGAALTNPMTTGGDLIYGGASGTPTRLANGAAGQLLQSAGSTSAPIWGSRIIRGAINADGTTAVGTGFSSSKTATGRYTITFTVAFAAQPVVILTPYAATSTQHAFLFSVPTTTGFNVDTTNFGGSDTDKAFNFIAMEG